MQKANEYNVELPKSQEQIKSEKCGLEFKRAIHTLCTRQLGEMEGKEATAEWSGGNGCKEQIVKMECAIIK